MLTVFTHGVILFNGANFTHQYEINEAYEKCLKTKEIRFFFSFSKLFQFFKTTSTAVTRAHNLFPYPRITVDCWTCDMKNPYIRCISIGNKYHLHWFSSSLYELNYCVIFSPISQNRIITISVQSTIIKVFTNSIGIELRSD